MKIFLDDRRVPSDTYQTTGWTVVRDVPSFKEFMQRFYVDTISLDHDLGLPESGYDAATWLEEEVEAGRITAPRVMMVHSDNPAGRARIQQVFDSISRIIGEL